MLVPHLLKIYINKMLGCQMDIRETNSDSDSEYLGYTVSDEAKCLNYPTFVYVE